MTTTKTKKGRHTSEFLVVILAMLINALNAKLGLGLTEVQLVGMDTLGGAYIGARTYAKGK